ncbi:MAG TPA: hypothetical protein VKR22_03245 [Acidimicrobiales bacterium]|nr:hypothetical protein [Acidimicrobiales bacterium]
MDFDAEIHRHEEAIEELQSRLGPQAKAVRQAVTEYGQLWVQQTVEKVVTIDNPERTETLGADGVKRIKRDLEAAIASIPGMVDTLLTEPLGDVEDSLRVVLGSAGTILVEHGYARTSPPGGGSEWGVSPSGTPIRYKFYLGQAMDAIRPALNRYRGTQGEISKEVTAIEAVKAQKTQAAAKHAWDEA